VNEDPKDTMLRAFQAEIQQLRLQLQVQLQAANPGLLVAEPKDAAAGSEAKVVVERVVEKLVGLSEEEARALEAKAAREARREADAALAAQSKEAAAREQQLRERLNKEAEERRELQARLQELEAKLIRGGDEQGEKGGVAGRDVDRRRLAQDLAIQEEANLALEEEYSSLHEEVEAKTRKLKRLWAKCQAQQREARDQQEEFQREREELLETVRQLTRQLKLKDLVLTNFVPPDDAARLEARARWSDELDGWTLPRLELAGNNRLLGSRLARPIASTEAGGGSSSSSSSSSSSNSYSYSKRRPETRFARSRRPYDTDPRFRGDNILELDLEGPPEGTTQHYAGKDTICKVARVLDVALDGEGEAEEAAPSSSSPYLRYAAVVVLRDGGHGGGGVGGAGSRRGRVGSGLKAEAEADNADEEEEEEEFPTARGLVR
jgi:kinesin family member 3B